MVPKPASLAAPAPARHRAEAVVLGALVGIGQDGVGLVDLLEALLGLLVAGVPVGVVLQRELAEGLLELGLAGVARRRRGSRSRLLHRPR